MSWNTCEGNVSHMCTTGVGEYVAKSGRGDRFVKTAMIQQEF